RHSRHQILATQTSVVRCPRSKLSPRTRQRHTSRTSRGGRPATCRSRFHLQPQERLPLRLQRGVMCGSHLHIVELAELFSVTHPCLLLGVLVASQRPQHVRMRKILCPQLLHSRFLALHELASTLLLPLRSFHPTHILGAFTGLLRRPLVGVQRVLPVIRLQVFGSLVRSNRVIPIRLVDRLTALLAVLADRPLKRLHIDTASTAGTASTARRSR